MNRICSAASLLSVFALTALASPVTFTLAVNTSSLAGATGSLDFQFNPGPTNSQAASVQILDFDSDGTPSGAPSLTGDASGALPGPLSLANSAPYNDAFQNFTFASYLSFVISLSGPALTSPAPGYTSGSAFAFSIFSDAAGSIPALTTDTTDGFAYVVNVNPDGSTNIVNYLTTSIPEADTGMLTGAGLAAAIVIGVLSKRQYRATSDD
jgi:hypothetical protein